MIRGLARYERLEREVRTTLAAVRRHGFGRPRYFQVLLCRRGARVVGFALYYFTYSTFLARPTLYLEDLFVLPAERGRLRWHQWPALVRQWAAVFPADPPELPRWYIHALVRGTRLCGFILRYLNHEEPGRAWVEYVGVDPAVRGSGLGGLLLQDFERRAAAAGCSRVVLGVRPDNRAAIRLYERRGYRPSGSGPGVVHYTKPLAGPAVRWPRHPPPGLRLAALAWRRGLYAVLVEIPAALGRRRGDPA
jgi:ribosomal protein S18 acetylase RimI-like enzyme